MHTIINPINSNRIPATEPSQDFRRPHYDCMDQGDVLKLVVYVPGVDPAGVEITARGPDLIVTARKSHVLRVNWRSLHLEIAQRDYQLRLRLGVGFDYEALDAALRDGALVIGLPKKPSIRSLRSPTETAALLARRVA
jgi:HSP20 family molecular chaperone IbpA